jgi:hypothetical protein
LLEGLKGTEKSVDSDGNITPYSLGNYIYRSILNLPARKRPKQKPITKVEASGDIILASYPNLSKSKPVSSPIIQRQLRLESELSLLKEEAPPSNNSSPLQTSSSSSPQFYRPIIGAKEDTPSLPTENKEYEYHRQGKSKEELRKTSIFGPKILIPIIGVVAVIAAVLAFTFLGSMNQTPMQEPLTPSPPSSSAPVPSTPPENIIQTDPVSNHPPVANNQSVTTEVNKPVDIALTASDSDTNDKSTAQTVSSPLNGRLGEINQDTGVVAYTPNPGFTGADSFTFKANDGKVDSNKTGTVGIAINQPIESSNHPPIANNQSIATTTNKVIDTTLTASDPDKEDNLTAGIVLKPLHGTLSNIDQNTGVVTYTPNPGFAGNDSFTFNANDGKIDSDNVGRVSITVNRDQS